MRLTTLTLCAATFVALAPPASAGLLADIGLADWCVDVNGNINTCNGGVMGNASIHLSGFDATLEPDTNNLGSITIKLGTGVQGVAVYMDYDIDFSTLGFDLDSGAAVGVPSSTQSWDIATPPKPFFALTNPNTPLSDTNTAGTFRASLPPCCDTSWALQELLFVDPTLYSGGTITFTVGTATPTSGFYLSQTNGDTGDAIYLNDTYTLTPLGAGTTVPEPTSIVLFGTLVAGVWFLRRRTSVNVA